MAVDVRERPNDRGDASIGGSLIFWGIVLILGIALFAWGLALVPQIGGYVLIIASAVPMGVGYTQIVTRIPRATHRIAVSLLIAAVFFAVLFGAVYIIGQAFPTPSSTSTVLLEPNSTS